MRIGVQVSFGAWLWAFWVTQAVEVPVYALAVRGAEPSVSPLRAALAGFACTAVSHPLFWFAWSRAVSNYAAYVASGEILVFLVESALFWGLARPVSLRRAVLASFAANAASCAFGFAWMLIAGAA